MPTNNQRRKGVTKALNRTDDYGLRPSIEVGDTAYDAYRQKQLPDDDAGKKSVVDTNKLNTHRKRFIISLLLIIASALVVTILFSTFLFQTYEVNGISMQPSLEPGDRLIISKVGKSFSSLIGSDYIPKRGEIVVFQPDPSSSTQLIKRVLAVTGERVVARGSKITVFNDENPNGFNPNDQNDLYKGAISTPIDMTVPEGHIFVSGDNRRQGQSFDSRTGLGTIPSDRLVGKATLRFIPFSELRRF